MALRLAGDAPDDAHMSLAAAWIRDAGGIAKTRVFTRIWLALFGEWPWDELPVMPPELIYLPRWVPLNVYDWGCWARQTIVPLTVVCSLRPVRPLSFGLEELDSGGVRVPRAANGRATGIGRPRKADAWGRVFTGLDRVLHGIRAARRRSCGRSPRSAPRPSGAAPSGSSPGRSGTAAGAASSRRGSTR